jgi:hypothetical protein
MHCSKGIPCPKHWQHFSSFVFPSQQAGITKKEEKEVRHFEK